MLLKCSTLDKRVVMPSNGKGKLVRPTGIKMTHNSGTTLNSRIHRKVLRIPTKRHPGKSLPGKLNSLTKLNSVKFTPGKRIIQRPTPPPCDNSNDSGLGFDQHVETLYHNNNNITDQRITIRSKQILFDDQRVDNDKDNFWTENDIKHQKLNNNIDIDTDDACSNETFVLAQRNKEESAIIQQTLDDDDNTTLKNLNTTSVVSRNLSRVQQRRLCSATPLQSQVSNISKNGTSQLQIIVQPEQQHRARYQTEGSRGAVKDRSGNGFPVVKLAGYNKPTVLQVFIGTDVGRVSPHMFYQACKVSGKNSTPCTEKKHEGTMIIEIDLKPENEMTVTCDCVGILKERNVDVEHRFPEQSGSRSKKKSTRCRMVFRVNLAHDDGIVETLQVCSQQIICTQPPGVPEICKKSLASCPVNGGLELFVIGKNFLKDTRVVFQERLPYERNDPSTLTPTWEESVIPDKEYLQQNHLVCTVPQYINQDITDPVAVHIFIISSGKKSESQNFMYTPKDSYSILSAATYTGKMQTQQQQNLLQITQQDMQYGDDSNEKTSLSLWNSSLEPKSEIDAGMMPPPSTLPISIRRQSSSGTILNEQQVKSPIDLKSELMDESSQNSITAENIDRYSNSNENCTTAETIKEILYTQQNLIKHPMDVIEKNSNMTIIVNENTMDVSSMPMSNFNNQHIEMLTSPEDLRVKQEQVIAAQLRAFVNTNSNQMLPDLQLKSELVPEAVTTASLFSNVNTTQDNSNIIFTQSLITTSQTKQIMSQPNFLDNFSTETTDTISQILEKVDVNTNSNDGILNGNSNRSPRAQDIILNSQAAVLNGANSLSAMLSGSPQSQHNMSPEIILNPAVSPTMMCQTNTDPTNLLTNSMLSGITIPQATQEAMLNNLIPTSLAPQEPMHISHKTPVAVKNMYLNAANHILTTQPTQSTLNALISMDQSMMNNQVQSQVTPMIIGRQSNVTNENISIYHPNERDSMRHQIIGSNQLQERQNVLADIALIAHQGQQMRSENNAFMHVNDGSLQAIQNLTQESHLQNLSLGRSILNDDQKMSPQNVVSTSTATTSIPQELTTMSDHDLISYINPSCFDQM